MITPTGLEKLGFTPNIDFILQNDNDGRGNYIAQWMSDKPQPLTQEIETAHNEWQAEFDAQAYARTRESAYPSTQDFMEAYTEKEIGGDSTKWDAYVIAYNKVRTDNPK